MHIRTYKTRRIQGSTGYQANSAETSETYESEALISIKSIANVSIEDCKTMKTIAYTKTEFFKKVAELTENLAADLKVKGIREQKRLPKIHYCWTHGAKCNHPSKNCRGKKRATKTRKPQKIKREEKTDDQAMVV